MWCVHVQESAHTHTWGGCAPPCRGDSLKTALLREFPPSFTWFQEFNWCCQAYIFRKQIPLYWAISLAQRSVSFEENRGTIQFHIFTWKFSLFLYSFPYFLKRLCSDFFFLTLRFRNSCLACLRLWVLSAIIKKAKFLFL